MMHTKPNKMKNTSILLLMLLFSFSSCHALDTEKKEEESLNKPSSAQVKMKIISYNILRGMERDTTEGKQHYINWLKLQDPDILALQETAKWKEADLQKQARLYNHPYAVLLKENNYCVAITSKYPIEDATLVTENMNHGFIKARINGYNVLVTHLSPYTYTKRREEIAIILSAINKSGEKEKWIVAGDFNSVSPLDSMLYIKSDRYLNNMKDLAKKYSSHDNLIDGDKLDFEVHQKILDFGLIDALPSFNKNYKITRPGRIDFIYVSKDLENKILNAEIIHDDFTNKYSDHFPLVLEIKTNENN